MLGWRRAIRVGLLSVLVLTCTWASALDVASAQSRDSAISCDSAVDVLEPVDIKSLQVVGKRVAIVRSIPRSGFQASTLRGWRFSTKTAILIRPRSGAVSVRFDPSVGRGVLRFGGDRRLRSSVRFPNCPAAGIRWYVFTGRIYLDAMSCARVVVEAFGRSYSRRVGFGVACD